MAARLFGRLAARPDDVPMIGRFCEIAGCSVQEAGIEVPRRELHDARTTGTEHPAFVAERTRGTPTSWRPFVATVPDAELRGADPAVYHGGLLVYESLWDRDHLERSAPALRRLDGASATGAGSATSILSLWCGNYYHWLVDALPRLAVLAAVGAPALPIATPATPTAFQEASLRALAVWERRLPFDGRRMRLESLVWPSGLDPIGFPSPRTTDWLRTSFPGAPPAGPGGRRLYVRRRRRTIANEPEVGPLLERAGFETIVPETLSFDEQVRVFSEAEAIVGCHGAGMANGVFARPGAQVLELFQPGYVNLSIYRLARAAGMRYSYLVGRAGGPSRLGKDRDVLVDTHALARYLELAR
jgi:hypothetical protein